jgi:hypothetical protein
MISLTTSEATLRASFTPRSTWSQLGRRRRLPAISGPSCLFARLSFGRVSAGAAIQQLRGSHAPGWQEYLALPGYNGLRHLGFKDTCPHAGLQSDVFDDIPSARVVHVPELGFHRKMRKSGLDSPGQEGSDTRQKKRSA